MITKATRRKIELFWENKCAICGNNDYLEIHHITPKEEGGNDDYDNLILLCACCHAAIHKRAYDAAKMNVNTSIDYESAFPRKHTLQKVLSTRDTKENITLASSTTMST